MPEDEGIAPPPPYQPQAEQRVSGADASAAALAAANAQMRDDNDDNDTAHVAPPSYDDAHYEASQRGRGGVVATAGSPSRAADALAEWNPFSSALPEASSASRFASASTPDTKSSSTDCPHWAKRGCSLTSGPRLCCMCLDKRPMRADGRYPVYIDGLGGRYGSTSRWAHYCSPCKEAEEARQRNSQQQLRFGSVNGVSGVSIEEPNLEAALRKERRKREREAELQRLSRAKAKHAVEQVELQHAREREREIQKEREEQQRLDKAEQQARQRGYEQNQKWYATHDTKRLRQVKHEQRMEDQAREALARRVEERRQQQQDKQQAIQIDLSALERDREALWKDIEALEAELVLKKARLQRLDTTYNLYKPRNVPLREITTPSPPLKSAMKPTSTSTLAPDKGKAPVMTEKQALALAEYEANKRAEALEERQRQASRQDGDYEVVSHVGAARTPLLSERTGGSSGSGSGSGSGSWFGRVFGRGKDKGREPELLPGEKYKNEHFYASKRAAAEAKATAQRNSPR
ncbi:hypothetical protein SBRCBS47491_002845 [Sporothrix bragantina]|uniref:Uncharacterized protein n=1 Tax=Sporothrix bragantina TaxID=671064 RepID=A0ABP0BA70_9PEZI